LGRPVVAPSANLSGHVSPTTAAHVHSDLDGRIDLIVDGGPVAVGVESTIIGIFDEPMLLRPGGLPRADIERVLGRALKQPPEDARATADSRWRRACWRHTMLRAHACGSVQSGSSPAKRCWRSAAMQFRELTPQPP